MYELLVCSIIWTGSYGASVTKLARDFRPSGLPHPVFRPLMNAVCQRYPQYLAATANGETCLTCLQRVALIQLLRLHIHKGMHLSDVSAIFGTASWLERAEAYKFVVLAGYVPIRWEAGRESAFVLHVLDDAHSRVVLYLSITGLIEKDELIAILRGRDRGIRAAELRVRDLDVSVMPSTRD